MVYKICNRILYRGFNTYQGGTKIIKENGAVVKGRWLTGQLVEVLLKTPPGAKEQPPILCLNAPGRRIQNISSCAVSPGTVGQFTGIYTSTEWSTLSKTFQQQWLKHHYASEWRGTPVFEGDIFWHRSEKRYYFIRFDLTRGFRLEALADESVSIPLSDSILKEFTGKNNLWQPPKDISLDLIQLLHKYRDIDRIEESLELSII